MEVEEKKEEAEKETKEENKPTEPEPTFELLNNPARVTRTQTGVISYDVDPRYTPVIEGVSGIILLKDNKPGEAEDILEAGKTSAMEVEEEEEVPMPEPFEFLG